MATAGGGVYFLLLAAVTTSSIWHVIGKLALTQGMDASVFLVYRLLLSAVLLLIGGKYVLKIELVTPQPEHRPRLVLVGIATFLHSIAFLYGLQMTTPFLCAVMQPSVPVLVWLISVSIGAEKPVYRKAVGVVICSIGAMGAAAVSSHHASATEGTDFETGTMLIVLQCIFYACHLVFQQPLLQAMPPVQVTGMLYVIAGVITLGVTVFRSLVLFLLPLIAPQTQEQILSIRPPYWLLSHDPSAWLALLFCVLFASAFTHGVYSWASKKVRPTTVSVFLTVEPVTTTLVSLIITRSGLPSLAEALCAGLVVVGVFLVLKGGSGTSNEYEAIHEKVEEEFELEARSGQSSPRRRGSPLEQVH
jgi:drug/metabolite transporter (DMT)-like permease